MIRWRRWRPRWDATITITYLDDRQRTVLIGDIRDRSRKRAASKAIAKLASMGEVGDDWLTMTVRVVANTRAP